MATSVRLPNRVEQALAAYCVETQRSKSEVIIELLEQRFSLAESEATPYERAEAAGFIGCVEGAEPVSGGYKKRAQSAIAAKHGRA
ncbi:MAG: CopG family transcriptional regulator [Hydrogenophilales bacterium CG17_big_fil_post_rev_8_21_14_2_50_63_12]|nr:MAG: CopG family transcriptional regulator [Hydrogenophilales bacterium CG17_big_fil_post_rev_8_21_14_2_50_63_12]PIX96556.1 MAG: CopG family transcriptional regulator [Hydrogenophilales bacterium CG_4_10_14_3_um_filter_63_21]PJB06366.1 MAG: CopG family transcriptional regulator [Hydrogenophilales bacterium CG_4_9_14_3_um_filter_63_34]